MQALRKKALIQLIGGSTLIVVGVSLTAMGMGAVCLMMIFPGIPMFFAGLASLKTPANRTP
jgi:hypothetical protein